VPFLVTAYPLTIVLITLTFFNRFFKNSKKSIQKRHVIYWSICHDCGLHVFGMDLGPLQTIKDILPLSSVVLEWIVPALVGTGIGIVLSKFSKKQDVPEQVDVKVS
jgi:branched-chain amino acid:cation transporter, LIVCS family